MDAAQAALNAAQIALHQVRQALTQNIGARDHIMNNQNTSMQNYYVAMFFKALEQENLARLDDFQADLDAQREKLGIKVFHVTAVTDNDEDGYGEDD